MRLGRRVWRSRDGKLAVILLAVVMLSILVVPLFHPYSPLEQDYTAILQGPSRRHLLGTDDLGRDVLARLLAGGRTTLLVGVASLAVSTPLGLLVGLVAGASRGWPARIVGIFLDALLAFPVIILALALTAALGTSVRTLVLAFGLVMMPVVARVVRGETLRLRDRTYIEAALLCGLGSRRATVRHVVPNLSGPLVVQMSVTVSYVFLGEAALSFLGAGVQPPQPAWGSMLRRGVASIEQSPWVVFAPGAAIFLTVLGATKLGDALRDVFDVRIARD